MWFVFFAVVISLLILDLGFLHNKNQELSFRHALLMSLFYVVIALLFGMYIWYQLGAESFEEYLTGFMLEKSLALDNIFLMSLVFSNLSIPSKYQHRVLFWGIIGVVILRGVMISLGVQLIVRFEWILYIFAVLMIVTGIKTFFVSTHMVDIKNNILLIYMRRYLRITDELHDQKFFVIQHDHLHSKKYLFVTPLFVALVLIEFIDLIFAFDSLPAIFNITRDPFIIYVSNIFAILGLRSLYFVLSSIVNKFYYIKFSLAVILIFIGSKMFIAELMHVDKIPPIISLGFTVISLSIGVLYSVYKAR
ncbi:TerC family protein [Candidatus Phycorickettsia trachydisci]|uniref:TerC family protein n=1 Tax=Candidatus Phycorickettsia trachydisci TaxID=2115978 RepID=A0A2P1P7S0_9RICK|nr:TerC/Alx family metal homeostasis membrane protein [Candidatus Phycorickettsia trachydisci]AVP87314.1 TerC family protein [Candidatus Phycorickettsia trachydisci]